MTNVTQTAHVVVTRTDDFGDSSTRIAVDILTVVPPMLMAAVLYVTLHSTYTIIPSHFGETCPIFPANQLYTGTDSNHN